MPEEKRAPLEKTCKICFNSINEKYHWQKFHNNKPINFSFEGHNFGLCKKCNKIHKSPKSHLNKKFPKDKYPNYGNRGKIFPYIGCGFRGHNFGLCEKCHKFHKNKRTEKFKEKMRLFRLGKHHSKETKGKIRFSNSIAMLGKIPWNKGKSGIYSRKTIEKIRLARLNQIMPFKDTSNEVIIQNILENNKIDFEKHKVIENFVQSDIFIEPNIVIFSDGCYWHACPICYPDKTKLDSIQNKSLTRDALVNQFFNNMNDKYIILRFWEHEINNNLENVMNKIIGTVEGTINIYY